MPILIQPPLAHNVKDQSLAASATMTATICAQMRPTHTRRANTQLTTGRLPVLVLISPGGKLACHGERRHAANGSGEKGHGRDCSSKRGPFRKYNRLIHSRRVVQESQ